MSMIKFAKNNEYWIKNDEWFIHCIMRFKNTLRFFQLKNYFHISFFSRIKQFMTRFFEKMKFIVSIIQNFFRRYCTSIIFVAIDEIMIRFTNRNKHIVMIRNKSCFVDFNVLTLCETNYCYVFVFSNSKIEFANVSTCFEKILLFDYQISQMHINLHAEIQKMIKTLSKINKTILHLIHLLSIELFFTFYCDNFFINANLFHVLRYYDFATCDIVRSDSKNWFEIFKKLIKRKTIRFTFNYQTNVVIHSNVCCLI